MAFGIAELVILGLLADWLMRKLRLPGLIGLLALGIAFGPHLLNRMTPETQAVAADWRLIALTVILLRAGLEISREVLARVGVRAMLLATIPCLLEVAVITVVAPLILPLTRMEAAMLGGVLAAVSPAVVVPFMIQFIKEGRGAKRGIPTMVLAGASVDDAVAIVLCTAFIGIYAGDNINLATQLATIPLSAIIGIITGLLLGGALCQLFDRFNPRATKRVLILMGLSLLLIKLEQSGALPIPFAPLLAIMAIGFAILELREHCAHEISAKLGKLWVFAQLLLFIFVGAQVDIGVAWRAGAWGALVILLGLAGRCVGVQICLLRSNLPRRERHFVTLAYLPKATVQAAIGAAPLLAMKHGGMNEAPGELILAIAVLAILTTAPIGAFAIAWGGKNLLEQDGSNGAAQAN
jgi:NhaP-type Na+/H+ or K+/H+ antiporter